MTKNKLLNKCLEELKTNEEARGRFDLATNNEFDVEYSYSGAHGFSDYWITYIYNRSLKQARLFLHPEAVQAYFVTKLLSRTRDGKAVMSFLDVPNKAYTENLGIINTEKSHDAFQVTDAYRAGYLLLLPQTLLDLLRREFTEALGKGKTFDEALDIINQIYCEYD